MDPQVPGDLRVVAPAAASNTIRARSASACALVRRRVQDSS
jgi:hypothetical protein